MQFFVQDENFDVDYFDEASIAPLRKLKLACNLGLTHLDKQMFKLHSEDRIRIVKQEFVNKTVTSNTLPHYEHLSHPYFTAYRRNYTERHDYNKDRLLVLIQKLVQVPFKTGTTIITFTDLDGKYDLLAGELSTEKLKWKKRTFTLKLRLYRFSLVEELTDDEDTESWEVQVRALEGLETLESTLSSESNTSSSSIEYSTSEDTSSSEGSSHSVSSFNYSQDTVNENYDKILTDGGSYERIEGNVDTQVNTEVPETMDL